MDYKWKALAIVSLGSLMGSIDSTVLIIGFPSVARDLNASLVDMVWVLLIYLVMGTALVLSLGRLADMKGRRRLYLAGFVVFTIGSALCGFAANGLDLIGFRALQGVGGAMLVANSFAIVSDAFPAAERGRAFGLISIVWGVGSVAGIFVGGTILTITSWRWIFWINLPIGVVSTALGAWVLRESVTPNPKDTFDFPAAILFTAGLVTILYGITEGILFGWTSLGTVGPVLAGLPLLVGFYFWERYGSRDPILPLSLFDNPMFSLSLLTSILQGVALFATNFLLMAYFQGIRGVSVLTASSLLVPLFVSLMILAPIGGRLSDRYGPRLLAASGLLIQAFAIFLMSTIDTSTPLWAVAGFEGILGVGAGLFFPANTAATMGSVPRERYGVASGTMMTFRNSAVALSYVLALVLLTSRLPSGIAPLLFGGAFTPATLASLGLTASQLDTLFVSGLHAAFLVSAVLVVAAALVSFSRGRPVGTTLSEIPASPARQGPPPPSAPT
jgi:EmrB/QacA subfamily drug resistance transporter